MAFLSALMGVNNVHHFSEAYPGAEDCTGNDMQSAISEWFNLYYDKGDYKQEDPCQRIPCAVVSKLYKACFSEYESEITKETEKGRFISRCQDELNRQKKKGVQLAMIGGESWLKPVPKKDGFSFTVVRRDAVDVLSRDSDGNVTDMISGEITKANGGFYKLLERRTVDPGGYLTIQNKLFFSQNQNDLGAPVPLERLPKYAEMKPLYTFPSPVGSIGLVSLKLPLENTVDGGADGVSVYAAATSLIHNINHNEWLLNQEFDNGAIRVIASADMLRYPEAENIKGTKATELPPGLFVGLEDDAETTGITVFNPNLRHESFLARKAEYLRNVESVLGFKRGILSEVEAAQRTAKEVTSSEGDYALTIQDLWDMWENADREAMRLCDVLGQMYHLCSSESFDIQEDISITWGNGVLYDKDKAWAETMQLVSNGMLKPELALAWKYDLPCDTPEDLQAIRDKYMPEMSGDDI